jgi:hypothetical protein
MATTFTTSIECYQNALGVATEPSTTTLPATAAIDLWRKTIYDRLVSIAGTSTDSNGVLKGIELELVSEKIRSAAYGYTFFLIIPEEYKTVIFGEFPDTAPNFYAFIPNQNG